VVLYQCIWWGHVKNATKGPVGVRLAPRYTKGSPRADVSETNSPPCSFNGNTQSTLRATGSARGNGKATGSVETTANLTHDISTFTIPLILPCESVKRGRRIGTLEWLLLYCASLDIGWSVTYEWLHELPHLQDRAMERGHDLHRGIHDYSNSPPQPGQGTMCRLSRKSLNRLEGRPFVKTSANCSADGTCRTLISPRKTFSLTK
jgi:hypothetical protein